jgi:hypothetical protein
MQGGESHTVVCKANYLGCEAREEEGVDGEDEHVVEGR